MKRLAAFAFGILVLLVYATGAELRDNAVDWSAAVRAALAAGLAWLLLVPLVIAADRRLPVARDVLYPRLLLHLPLSVAVSWAFAYVYLAVAILVPGSFQPLGDGPARFFDLLFYSFTNLTSVGLSDILPVRDHARSITMLEQIAGVLYVAMVISRMVTLTVPIRRP